MTVPAAVSVMPLAHDVWVYGAPDEARARLGRWQAAGAALPILLLPPDQKPAQIDFALEALC